MMRAFIWIAAVLLAVVCAYAILWYASVGNASQEQRSRREIGPQPSRLASGDSGERAEWRQRANKYFRLAEEREKRARLSLDPELRAKILRAAEAWRELGWKERHR
jgi:hypothetical protein